MFIMYMLVYTYNVYVSVLENFNQLSVIDCVPNMTLRCTQIIIIQSRIAYAQELLAAEEAREAKSQQDLSSSSEDS